MSKENINVYWAPYYEIKDGDWSLLYPKPETLLSSLRSRRLKDNPNATFFDIDASYLSCPAINSKFNNTYVFSNLLKTKCTYNFENNNVDAENVGETGLNFNLIHTPTIKDGPLFEFKLAYILFADKPLTATFSAPYFHPAGYTKYGSVIPGEFDIGQWFRPYIVEVQMWSNKGEFIIGEEPIFYLSFPGDEKITLHRFNYTEQLQKYSQGGLTATGVFGKGQSLISRYNRFKAVGLREKILTEIKQNLIDDTL